MMLNERDSLSRRQVVVAAGTTRPIPSAPSNCGGSPGVSTLSDEDLGTSQESLSGFAQSLG